MRKLGVLAGEAGVAPFLRAAHNIPQLEPVAVWAESAEVLKDLAEEIRGIPVIAEWDRFVEGMRPDVLLVCGTSPALMLAARQLAATGIPLWIVVDVADDPSRLFEYMPLWQDDPGRIRPVYSSGLRSLSRRAVKELEHAGLGPFWKLTVRRNICAAEGGRFAEWMDRWLLQDLDWIRELCGAHSLVTLQTSGLQRDQPREAWLTLRGPDLPEARWHLALAPEPGLEATLHGAGGDIIIRLNQGDVPPETSGNVLSLTAADGILADAREQLQQATDEIGTSQGDLWRRLIQMGEVGAAARRSLQRQRTVEVHFEEASERNQFKSQMAALGCGTLLWTMFGMIALLCLGPVIDPRDDEYRQSASAGFLLRADEFVPGRSELTASGAGRLRRVARDWTATSPLLIVEESASGSLDDDRRQHLAGRLRAEGIARSDGRILVRPLPGRWFERGMLLAWGVVFLPLAFYLAMQLLIVAARGPGAETPS